MKPVTIATATLVAITMALTGDLASQDSSDFSPYVDAATGSIQLPDDFRENWVFLGTWSIASGNEDGGASGFHNVYTQPEVVKAYRESGEFPDGAVLVKELLFTNSDDFTTGYVSYADEIEGWFVMVKDGVGRFPDNPLWGDGWGWSLFLADDPDTTVTQDYEADCIGCHIPAQDTDWIYVQGYPVLHD